MRLCVVCKQVIDPERVESIPQTRLCGDHAREIVKFGGEFRLAASQERTSKQGSLKLNYGGITTEMIRNEEALDRLIDAFEADR